MNEVAQQPEQANPRRASKKGIWSHWFQLRYLVVLALCIMASAGGILISIRVTQNCADAGRGGAIGDIVSLGFFFLNHGYGTRLFSILIEPAHKREQTAREHVEKAIPRIEATTRLDYFFACMQLDAMEMSWQNFYMALATAISTLAWGFGDCVTRYFLPTAHNC